MIVYILYEFLFKMYPMLKYTEANTWMTLQAKECFLRRLVSKDMKNIKQNRKNKFDIYELWNLLLRKL